MTYQIGRAVAPLLCFLLQGCFLPTGSGSQGTEVFVLEPSIPAVSSSEIEKESSKLKTKRLVIAETTAFGVLGSTKILFSRDQHTRGSYQYSRWADPPPERISAALIAAFDSAEAFASVGRAGSLDSGDWILQTDLRELCHFASERPGDVEVQLRVEILETRRQMSIATRTFTVKHPASAYTAEGAVNGYNAAVQELIVEVRAWALSKLSQQSS